MSVDGKTINIFKPFTVGESTMMFPLDQSLGASLREICRCRCVCKYSGKNGDRAQDNILQNSNKGVKLEADSSLVPLYLQFFATIEDNKLFNFLLDANSKHGKDFLNVGYSRDNPEQLRNDILDSFDNRKDAITEETSWGKRIIYYQDFGISKQRRFKFVWQYDNENERDLPKLITAYREDLKK